MVDSGVDTAKRFRMRRIAAPLAWPAAAGRAVRRRSSMISARCGFVVTALRPRGLPYSRFRAGVLLQGAAAFVHRPGPGADRPDFLSSLRALGSFSGVA